MKHRRIEHQRDQSRNSRCDVMAEGTGQFVSEPVAAAFWERPTAGRQDDPPGKEDALGMMNLKRRSARSIRRMPGFSGSM